MFIICNVQMSSNVDSVLKACSNHHLGTTRIQPNIPTTTPPKYSRTPLQKPPEHQNIIATKALRPDHQKQHWTPLPTYQHTTRTLRFAQHGRSLKSVVFMAGTWLKSFLQWHPFCGTRLALSSSPCCLREGWLQQLQSHNFTLTLNVRNKRDLKMPNMKIKCDSARCK